MTLKTSMSPKTFIWKLVEFEQIESHAREHGFFLRQRLLKLLPFMVTILFSFGSLADLRRRYASLVDGKGLARTAWNERFNPKLVALTAFIAGFLQQLAESKPPRMKGPLRGLKDVIAVDSTVVPLHPALEPVFRGCTGAALKIHTRVRALTGELLRHRITAGARADCHSLGFDWRDAKKLFLFDRGYASATLWFRAHRVSAFFCTRLPTNYKPWIAAVNKTHRGRSRGLVGKSLRAELKRVKRSRIDVMCRFRVHIRGRNGQRGRYEYVLFRVVGIWNIETRRYHLYVTNLPAEDYESSLISDLYRLRWEVETFYRLGKGILGLDHLRTAKSKSVALILVRCALIRHSVTMQACCLARSSLTGRQRINTEQWARVFQERMESRLALEILGLLRLVTPWVDLIHFALDPNLSRNPHRERFSFDYSSRFT